MTVSTLCIVQQCANMLWDDNSKEIKMRASKKTKEIKVRERKETEDSKGEGSLKCFQILITSCFWARANCPAFRCGCPLHCLLLLLCPRQAVLVGLSFLRHLLLCLLFGSGVPSLDAGLKSSSCWLQTLSTSSPALLFRHQPLLPLLCPVGGDGGEMSKTFPLLRHLPSLETL